MNSDLVPESLKGVTDDIDRSNCRVVVTTSSKAGVYFHQKKTFSHVFIDESAQITEPETLIPIILTDITKGVIVLAGDHQQLGPVVQSSEAIDYKLNRSLMERLMISSSFQCYQRNEIFKSNGYYDPKFVVKLVINHRSDSKIMAVPSKLFYKNELIFINETDEQLFRGIQLKASVNFHGVNGQSLNHSSLNFFQFNSKGNDILDTGSLSYYNKEEVKVVSSYLTMLYRFGVKSKDIGLYYESNF